ncbi:uncharacterized protein LOC106712295 [Papilio machaon]|uniref:uncharacterized protein LOC106712295 n=1 Tax=Papilio machaon TaxID=76193 RepID=UPI001E664BAB|nr:uncharacterized protein LOC106712295 [Papilio machaon]
MNEFKMFEIDPKLFVTCRLCLENMGAYQIVPTVQKQIRFCYDIEVDPFDALPQLICKDCESTLRTYFEVKTNYIEKQKKLKEQLKLKNAIPHGPAIQQEDDVVTSSQEICNEGNNVNRKRIISFRSSLSEASNENCSVKSKDKRKSTCEFTKEPDVFELGYKKWFVCRFCNHQFSSKSKIERHINTHTTIKQKYINLIKRDCYVKLEKFDNKPNICKSKKYVVHSSDKITHSAHNFYHVIIKPKENSNNRLDGDSSPDLKHISGSDDSDDDIIPIRCKNRRRKNRILSNDTVVIEKDDLDSCMLDDVLQHEASTKPNVTEINENECIRIDDSDTESFKSGDVLTNDSTNLFPSVNSECKTINNIISLCFKRHLKRLESNDTIEANTHTIETNAAKLDSHLKHKVLSIGKKMITNSAFSCTGILRYLEHQNLEIVWTPKMPKTSNKKSDCVRIMLKLKNHDENDGESGWKVLEDPNKVDRQPNHISENPVESDLFPKTVDTCVEQNNIRGNHADSSESGAVLNAVNVGQEKDKMLKKLLNENPVANPKTLTKKPQFPTFSINKKKRTKTKEKSVPVDMPILETAVHTLMPVITSTVSLATPEDVEKKQRAHSVTPSVPITLISGPSSSSSTILSTDRTIPEQEPVVANYPRIKVKPASQLMSNPALNITAKQFIPQANSQNVNMAYQNNTNGVNMNVAPIPRFDNATGLQINPFTQALFEPSSVTGMQMSYGNDARENVIMHSVDLPNTKTTSPFEYLKRLLQIHNIYLLSPDEVTQDIFREFICLLKFKLVFQQESATPVALCLALFNLKDKFFVKVTGVNDGDIDICRLSPNWQWEILKIYCGEVVPKMLQNAEKISAEVLMNTRNFIYYLKSIEFRKNA